MRRLSKDPKRRLSNVYRSQLRRTTPGMLLLVERKCFDCIVLDAVSSVGVQDPPTLKNEIRKEIARRFMGNYSCKCRDLI